MVEAFAAFILLQKTMPVSDRVAYECRSGSIAILELNLGLSILSL